MREQYEQVPDQEPEMTVEWQVSHGNGLSVRVFRSQASVRRYLAEQWSVFMASWTPDMTCCLSVEVRRVEREVVKE